MNQLPVPEPYVPAGGLLLPHGHAYADAVKVPLVGGESGQTAELLRVSELWEILPEEVKVMAGNGWRFWLRWVSDAGGQPRVLTLEPLVAHADPWPFLDSTVAGPPQVP